MYLVIEAGPAWWAMEGASCGCMARMCRREVVIMGAGSGESVAVVEFCSSAAMVAGWAGVVSAIVVRTGKCGEVSLSGKPEGAILAGGNCVEMCLRV